MQWSATQDPAETHRLDIEDIAPVHEELFEDQLRLVIGGLRDTGTATGCLGVWDPVELS